MSGTHPLMNSLHNWDAMPLAFTETEANLSYLYMNSSLLNLNTSSSNSTNLTNVIYYPYYQHSLPVAASLTMAYLFIFLLCMVGNSLVCFIMLENRRMRTVTNLFILNLAVSDLLVGIFCIPTTLVDNLITGWPFSNMVCKLSGLAQGMSVASSVFSLVAIAVDRFRCIVYPFKPKLTSMVAKMTITMIWVLAFVIMFPSAVTLTVQHVTNHFMVHNLDYKHTYPLLSCFENWADAYMRKVYTTVLFAHIYLIPLAIITLMYGRIGVKLYTTSVVSGNRQQKSAEGQNAARPFVSNKKIKAIKMLIVVALLFMLSWLPLWILMLLTDYGGLEQDEIEFLSGYVFPFAHWLAFSNSSVNPIIYGYYNENFKQGFKTVCGIHSWCCCGFTIPSGTRRDHRASAGDRREAAVHSNSLPFGARNRVYTDSNLKIRTSNREEEQKKGGCRLSRSASVDNARSEVADQGNGVASQKGLQMEDLERISPTGMTVSRAWDQ